MTRGNRPVRNFSEPRLDLDGQSILMTGGTGSFGRHFVRTVLDSYSPRKLIVFSRDEFKQFEMMSAFPKEVQRMLRFFIGDVRDRDRLELAMREVDVVVHAAALKRIETAEYNPFECLHTNVYGAENVVQAALSTGVKQVIALSTDKAASPINLYGASKLASDKIFVAANSLSGSIGTRFSVVRYGNVFGSRGSVVPLYLRLIAEGADSLPITDARMTRFWITLQQGVDFVLSSLAMMEGGEIFVPKIPSMKITDVARALASDLPHHTLGIRPGEKLHEVMITEDDARTTIELNDRFIIEPAFASWERTSLADDGGVSVDEAFRYASDTNNEWLDADGFHALLTDANLDGTE